MRKNTYWPYIVIAYTSLAALGLLDNSRGPFFPDLSQSLNLSDSKASLFFAFASFVSFVASFLSKYLLPRMSTIWGIRISLAVMIIGFYLFSLAQNFSQLMAYCVVFGFGYGMLAVFQNVCVQQGASLSGRRRLFSGLHSMYALASLMGPVIAGWMFNHGWSWRQGFQVIAGVPLVVLLVSVFTKPLVEDEPAPLASAEKKLAHGQLDGQATDQLNGQLSYWAAGFILAFYVTAELAVSSRLALYLRRVYDFSPSKASLYLSFFFVLLLFGRLIFTWFKFPLWSSVGIMKASLLASIVAYGVGVFVSPWGLVVCGLTMAPFFAFAMDYLAERFQEQAGEAIAIAMTLMGLMVVVMHYLIGYLSDIWGLRVALCAGLITLLASLGSLLFQQRSSRQQS